MRALTTALLLASAPAHSLEPPTPVDTLAMYCATIAGRVHQLFMQTANVPGIQKEAAEAEARYRRFQIYSTLRLGYVDPLPMLAAQRAALADWQESKRITMGGYEELKSCVSSGRSSDACISEQTKSLQATDVSKRMQRCNSSDWLPL